MELVVFSTLRSAKNLPNLLVRRICIVYRRCITSRARPHYYQGLGQVWSKLSEHSTLSADNVGHTRDPDGQLPHTSLYFYCTKNSAATRSKPYPNYFATEKDFRPSGSNVQHMWCASRKYFYGVSQTDFWHWNLAQKLPNGELFWPQMLWVERAP